MRYLLNAVYLGLLIAASPWLSWSAIRRGKYREGFWAKFLGLVPRRVGNAPCLWLHAVSVGEVALVEPLLRVFQQRHPNWDCVVSTTTMTGYRVARERYANCLVFYAPLDFSWAVREAMRRIRPELLVLAELELWPNLIAAAREAGAKVTVVNGRLSERSFHGYRRIRPLVAPVLRSIDAIAAQSNEYATRFVGLGADPEKVTVTGSLKFDGAQTDRNLPATNELRELAGIAPDDVVFLAGSTQEPEEGLAVDAFCRCLPRHPELRLILVPRHPERFDAVAAMLDARGVRWQRRSHLGQHVADPSARILLVDRVGELRWWWGTATIGFVGGSLGPRGGQNMIEPAAYGVATCFGPRTHNFREVVRLLLANDAAVVVEDGPALTEFVDRCLADHTYAGRLASQARSIVNRNLGASQRTVELLECLIERKRNITKAA